MIHLEQYPEYSISLPNPLVGESVSSGNTLITYRSMGNLLHSYRSETKKIILDMSFENLSKQSLNDLINFVENTFNKKVKLTDRNERVYVGYIVDPNIETVTTNKYNEVTYSIKFNCEEITEYLINENTELLAHEPCKDLLVKEGESIKFLLNENGNILSTESNTQLLVLEDY